MKGKLICVSGIDGTGKTTLAKKLVGEFSYSGIKCKYAWFRRARFISLPFLAFCYLTGYAKSIKLQNGTRAGEYHFYKNKLIARLWLWISALDILFLSLWRVFIPLKRGYTVVTDRYVIDALVDMMCDTKMNSLNNFPCKLLLRFLPEKIVNIILDVNEEIAFQRKNDTLSLEYLKQRRKVYLKLSQELKIPVINTEGSLDDVWSSLQDVLLRSKDA